MKGALRGEEVWGGFGEALVAIIKLLGLLKRELDDNVGKKVSR